MPNTAFVRARIDEKIRDDAAAVLADMGLTVSDVVRMTLTKVAKDGALPYELKVPNAETRAAMEESRAMMKTKAKGYLSADKLFEDLNSRLK
jgi:DNA-damage-inducible protein J